MVVNSEISYERLKLIKSERSVIDVLKAYGLFKRCSD